MRKDSNKKLLSTLFKGKNVTAYPNGEKAKAGSKDLRHRAVSYAVKKVSKKTLVCVAMMTASFSTIAVVTAATGGNMLLGRAAGMTVGSMICGKAMRHFLKGKKVTAYANGEKTENGNSQIKHGSLKEKIKQHAKDFKLGFKTIVVGYVAGITVGATVGAVTGNPVAAYAAGMTTGVSVNRHLLSKRNKKNR